MTINERIIVYPMYMCLFFYFYIGKQENENDLSTILCPDTFFNYIMVLYKFPYSSEFGAR